MSPLAFAWRSLIRQPARAVLGVLGVAAVGALLFDMLLLSRGLLLSFRDLLDSLGYDVRITRTSSMPGFGPPIEDIARTLEELRALPELEEVTPVDFGRADVLLPNEKNVYGAFFIGSEVSPRHRWTVIEGADLGVSGAGAMPEILINRNLADAAGISPGAALRLRVISRNSASLPAAEFRVAGVAKFPFESATGMTVATTLPAYVQAHGGRELRAVDMLLVASDPAHGAEAAVAAIQRARPDLHAFSNEHYVARLRNRDFSYFRQISFVLSSVTLFFAFLLITTLLTVSVNQRFIEVAALRALGFPRRRVVADLLWESGLLVGTGGLLALPLGALLARWLDAILRAMPGIPERLHFFVYQPRAVVLHVMLLAVTGLLAALYPVYLAARLPIAATLRREVVS